MSMTIYVLSVVAVLWLATTNWRRLRCRLSAVGSAQGVFDKDNSAFSLSPLHCGKHARRSQTQTHTGRMHFCSCACATELLLCGLSYPFQPLSAKHFRFRVTFGSLANIRRQRNLASPLGISPKEGLPCVCSHSIVYPLAEARDAHGHYAFSTFNESEWTRVDRISPTRCQSLFGFCPTLPF